MLKEQTNRYLQVFTLIFHPLLDFAALFKIGNRTDIVAQAAVAAQAKIALSRQAHIDRRIIAEIRTEFYTPAAAAARKQHRTEDYVDGGERQDGKYGVFQHGGHGQDPIRIQIPVKYMHPPQNLFC